MPGHMAGKTTGTTMRTGRKRIVPFVRPLLQPIAIVPADPSFTVEDGTITIRNAGWPSALMIPAAVVDCLGEDDA